MRIKDLREERGITQSELGVIVQQSKSNISKYERGVLEPGISTIIKLAGYFDVSIDYLLGVSDVRNPLKPPVPIEIGLNAENKTELKKFADLLKLKQMSEQSKKTENGSKAK